MRSVVRLVCGQPADPSEEDIIDDHPAVVLVLTAIGYGNDRHWREVEVNGRRTPRVDLGGGFPQGLSPSPLFYAICGEGLNGLLAVAGVEGIEVNVPDTVTVRCNSMKFADDFTAYVRSQHLHRLFDVLDVFCAGSANDLGGPAGRFRKLNQRG